MGLKVVLEELQTLPARTHFLSEFDAKIENKREENGKSCGERKMSLLLIGFWSEISR